MRRRYSPQEKAVLKTQSLLQGRHTAARNGNLLLYAIQSKKERSARDGLDLLDHGQIDQVAAMNAKESMAVEALFELSQRDRGEVTIGIGLQVRIIIARHNVANAIDGDENLLAALLDRNALGLGCLHVQGYVFGGAIDGLMQTNRSRQALPGNRQH